MEFWDFDLPEGKIIVVGDTRPKHPLEFILEREQDIAPRMFEAIAAEKPAALIHLGDMVRMGASWKSWHKTFDKDVHPVLEAGIPIFPVLGNHEFKYFPAKGLINYFTRFPLLEGRRWYSLKMGRLLQLQLDSNFMVLWPSLKHKQNQWLRAQMREADQDPSIGGIVVHCHHPPMTNVSPWSLVGPNFWVRRHWLPVFRSSRKLRAVFSGHIHNYEHFQDGRVHYIVTGGGGSPRFHLLPRRINIFKDLYPDPRSIREFHYMRLTPGPGKLSVEMVKWNEPEWSTGERCDLVVE
jgi:hypothetical protein